MLGRGIPMWIGERGCACRVLPPVGRGALSPPLVPLPPALGKLDGARCSVLVLVYPCSLLCVVIFGRDVRGLVRFCICTV